MSIFQENSNLFYMKKVYVARTKNVGEGLFAKNNIKREEAIFVFKGKLIKASYDSDCYIGPRWLGVGRCLWINVSKTNPGYYINHSCKPNAGFKGKVTVVAMRNIKKDEEITIDYSITEEDPYWKMKCKCGEKNCRKIIRSIQFLPEKIFKKYKSFIPIFFQKSYMMSHK